MLRKNILNTYRVKWSNSSISNNSIWYKSFVCTQFKTVLFDSFRCYHFDSEWTWEQWQLKGTLHCPMLQLYWNLTIRCLMSYPGFSLGVGIIPIGRNTVVVFYSPSRLSWNILWHIQDFRWGWGVLPLCRDDIFTSPSRLSWNSLASYPGLSLGVGCLTPLQRYAWYILQPQPTELKYFVTYQGLSLGVGCLTSLQRYTWYILQPQPTELASSGNSVI